MRLTPLLAVLGCALFGASACKSPQTSPEPAPPAPTTFAADIDPEARALAEREIVRRQQATLDALELMEQGDRLQADGDFEGARRAYQQSIQKQR